MELGFKDRVRGIRVGLGLGFRCRVRVRVTDIIYSRHFLQFLFRFPLSPLPLFQFLFRKWLTLTESYRFPICSTSAVNVEGLLNGLSVFDRCC